MSFVLMSFVLMSFVLMSFVLMSFVERWSKPLSDPLPADLWDG